jgi:pectate lyase
MHLVFGHYLLIHDSHIELRSTSRDVIQYALRFLTSALHPEYLMIRFPLIVLMAVAALVFNDDSELLATDLSKRPATWFGSDEGRAALDCMLSWQSEYGDWPKNTNTAAKPYTGDRAKIEGTFDNGATTGELRTLAHAFQATGDTRYEKAFLKGFDHLVKAQYANGGWPQYFPLRTGYYSHITFNDHCMVRILEFLTEATTDKPYDFLDQDRRLAATRAIGRGIDCIVQCQVVVRGVPTVWCAQHDAVTLAPAKARSYELASLSGSESAGILKYLMSLDAPDPKVIRSVKAGMVWFEAAKIQGIRVEKIDGDRQVIEDPKAAPVWARFYEIETNRPFFCDRDGIPKYALKEIGSERRNGYGWYGNWGDSLANMYAKWKHR